MAISSDPRDGHELLMLPLLPPRILCANACHYPHPLGTCAAHHCQGPVIQGQLPRENTWPTSGCCNVMLASEAAGSTHIPILTTIPLPLPSVSEQGSPNKLLL